MADRNDAVTMSLEEAKILVMQGMKGDPGESPRINPENNHWEVYDNDTKQWVDTGVNARGPKGDPGSGEGGGSSLPEVDSSDVGKVLRVNSYAEWDVLDPPEGVPDYSTASDGQVLSVYNVSGTKRMLWETPSTLPNYSNANTGNVLKIINRGGTRETAWDSSAYQILVTKTGSTYTVHSAVTAENVVANKGNLVIILNGGVLYNCVGALTSDFGYGHFYFVAAKPTDSAIETEWLDLQFFTGENGSVSVTPVSFDIKGTKWLDLQYDLGTDSYTPNFTAADVANGLPNAVLTLGERRYSPVGWEIDEGLLVNATFARATYDSNGYAGLDCFKVNNSGGSFTVRRYTIPADDTFEIPVTRSNSTYSTTVSAADIIAHRKNLIVSSTGIMLTYDGCTFSGLDVMSFYFSARQINYTSHTEFIYSMTINASILNGADTVTITAENYSIELTPD